MRGVPGRYTTKAWLFERVSLDMVSSQWEGTSEGWICTLSEDENSRGVNDARGLSIGGDREAASEYRRSQED